MPRCLNTEEIRQFRQGAMAAEELLRADLHIAGCEACRARLLDSPQLAGAARSLAERVRWNPKVEFNCLDDEQAAAYVEGGLDATDREIVESHLAACARCVEDVRSLDEFRAEMKDYPETVFGPEPRRAAAAGWSERMRALFAPRRLAWALAGAAVVLAAFFGGRLWRDARPSPQMERVEAQLRATREQLARTERELQDAKQNVAAAEGRIEKQGSELAKLRDQASRKAPAERALVALRDGSGTVEARLKLPADLPRDLAQATAQLLETGEAAASESAQQTLARLVAEGEDVRSTDETPAPLSPVRTLVLSDRPAFRWAPVKGATSHVISLFQDQPRRLLWEQSVGTIGESAFPSDRPPLSPGETYAWMVEARRPDRSSFSSLVKFQVLAGPRRAEVQSLSRRYAGWHTVLAALYEREGLYDEAARELQSLVRRNPGSKSARRLLDALRSR